MERNNSSTSCKTFHFTNSPCISCQRNCILCFNLSTFHRTPSLDPNNNLYVLIVKFSTISSNNFWSGIWVRFPEFFRNYFSLKAHPINAVIDDHEMDHFIANPNVPSATQK